MKKLIRTLWLLGLLPVAAAAADLRWNAPYGIGSIQLPWQSTEVFFGAVKAVKGGNLEQIAGASLPVLTIGKLSNGYRITDGQLGASGSWPVQGNPVDVYGAIGHDIIQDIPGLSKFKSAHLNACTTYSSRFGSWMYGGTLSYAFGGSSESGTQPASK